MKINVKRKLLLTLTTFALICSAFFALSTTVFGKSSADGATFETVNFTMREGASVRIGSNDAGTEFDYTKNGIRFTAKMSVSDYEAIKDDASVTYGILVAPKDYHDKNPLNEANVFGAESVYSFDDTKIKIANITTKTLVPVDEDKNGTTDYYGYNASMVNLKPDNVTRQFVAVCYISKTEEILVDGQPTGGVNTVYRFCENNLSSRSMSYVAQLALENENTPEFAKESLQNSYITGRTVSVSVACEKYYGEEAVGSTGKDVVLGLGDTISAEALAQELGVEYSDEYFTLSNASEVNGKKVYADGMTGALTLKYSAIESVATDYNQIKGLYKTEDGSSVKVSADKTVEIDGAAAVAYTLYKDGTVKTTVGDKPSFGKYDLNNRSFSISVDSSVLDYAEVLELNDDAYDAIAKTYNYNGTLIELYADGTLAYAAKSASEQSGVFALAYDENSDKTYIVIVAGETVITKEITESAGEYTIDGFSEVQIASKAQYTALAEYYSDASNYIYKFNTDGTIVSVQSADTTVNGTFVLFADETMIALIGGESLSGSFSAGSSQNVITLSNDTVSYTFTHKIVVAGGKTPYEIFASESGTLYSTNNTNKYIKWILYSTVTEMVCDLKGDYTWYQVERKNGTTTAFGKSDLCYRLEPLTDDGLFGKIHFIKKDGENYYNSTGTIYYGMLNGVMYLTTEVWDPTGGTYFVTCEGENRANVKLNANNHIADMKGKVYENAGAGEAAEPFDIYADFAGTYQSKKTYDGSADWWWYIGMAFNADKTVSMVGTPSKGGNYELIPYTDSFGMIKFNPGYGTNYDSSGTHTGYYAKINGEYVLRIMMNPAGVNYWHFMDFRKSANFNSWTIFDNVVGTESDAMYTDGSASLKLCLIKDNFPADHRKEKYYGSKFVFTAGDTVINGTYDFVATSLTAGKIFLDFSATPGWDLSDTDRYVIGDYALLNGEYVISFTYKGTAYSMSVKDVNAVAKNAIKGAYAGVSGSQVTITVDDESTVVSTSAYTGKVTVGGVTADYVIESNRIVITYKDASYNDVIVIKAR